MLDAVTGRVRVRWLLAILVIQPGWETRASAQPESVFDVPDRVWILDGIRVPAVADSFALLQVRRYPRLDLGFSLLYATPISSRADLNLYVYPVPPDRLTEDPWTAIEPEFESSVRSMFEYAETNRAGTTVSVERREETSIRTAGGEEVRGMRAVGEFEHPNARHPTSLYLFVKGDLYLKYRISYHGDDEALLEPHLVEWIRLTYEGVEPAPAPPPRSR